MIQQQPLCNKLKSLKESGCPLDIQTVDYDTMYELWHNEFVFDADLAELFDTTKYQVQKRRKELDISIKSIAIQEVIKKYHTLLPQSI
jgi:hypothetical protein